MAEGLFAPPKRIEKPWGYELVWAHSNYYVGKILHIRAGEALSLQYHEHKDETVMVIRGKMQMVWFTEGQPPQEQLMEPMIAMRIRPGTRHRMIAIEDTDVVEVSTTQLDDVVRLSDKYGRAK